ncbi:MAG: hypothetical protein ACR2PG_16870 [Hyphomicrobiaceae bacterium]
MDFSGEMAPLILVGTLILLSVVIVFVATQGMLPLKSPIAETPGNAEVVPPRKRIYDIADQLSQAYNVAAHPDELILEAPFQKGIALLAGAEFSLEEVWRFAVGDHPIISCMAFEAMRRREDTVDTRREVAAGIDTFPSWVQYFALKCLAEKTPSDKRLLGLVLARSTVSMQHRLSSAALAEFIRKRHAIGEPLEFEPEDTWFLSYREAPSPLVRDLARGWRTGRVDLVLGGDFDLIH